MSISILGAGAFGTSLAIALGKKNHVTLWARDSAQVYNMQADRENKQRLPDARFPDNLEVTASMDDAVKSDLILIAVPMQLLGKFLSDNSQILAGKQLVACCKGIDRATGRGPVDLIETLIPSASAAVLTGPSFAADIARGLPTALSIACADDRICATLQTRLSTPAQLRPDNFA